VRCIRCGNDSNYRARQDGRCGVCGKRFVFEPRNDRRVTDLMFELALDAVSDQRRLGWTDDHLYHDVCRRVRRRRPLHRVLRRPFVSLDRFTFEQLLARWIDTHGPPPGRLQRRVFSEVAADAAPAGVESYGFEHLVICDDDSTADVLLVNGFHTDHKCPVLSYSGYPAHVYEPLIPVLRERPPATVVVVHDADWDGCALAGAIVRDPRWFAGVELPQVVDAGLRPGDAARFRGLVQVAGSRERAAAPDLPAAEARWLRTNRLALAAARPRVLMAVLARVLRGGLDVGAAAAAAGAAAPIWADDVWGDGDDEVG
jgi:hypothetical protein